MSVNVPGVPWTPPPPSYLANPTTAPVRAGIVVLPAALVAGQLVAGWTPGKAVELLRLTVSADNNVSCFVYVGERIPANLVSATYNGGFDENECVQPILVPEGAALNVAWSTPSGSARVRVEYRNAGV